MQRVTAVHLPRWMVAMLVATAISCVPAMLAAQAADAGATPEGPAAVFDALARLDGASPAQVRLITDNQEAWYARWYVVSQASRTIDTTYFILEDDIFGRAFLGALRDKARRGVKVRLMIDAHGNGALSHASTSTDVLRELAAAPGVDVRIFNPIRKAIFSTLLDVRGLMASNHDKLIIADGEWVITGGRNISKDYLASPEDNPAAFRDTDVLVRGGDIPRQAENAFDGEFAAQSAMPLAAPGQGSDEDRARELETARLVMNASLMGVPVRPPDGQAVSGLIAADAQEIARYAHLTGYPTYAPFGGEHAYPTLLLDKGSHRDDRPNAITSNLIRLIDSAREEIVMQNPYVVLSDEGKQAIARAGQRGVKVLLHTNSPSSTNHLMTQAAFVRDWKDLMRATPGMRIFALDGSALLHAKVFVIDRQVAMVGTYNLDPVSSEINAEDVAAVDSRAFATQSALRILDDCSRSTEYRIQIDKAGKVTELTGPDKGIDPLVMKQLDRMIPIAALLRPLL